MKKNYSLLLLLLTSCLFAQIPAGYYNAATGNGYALKTQLFNIIKTGYIDKDYGGLYDTYQTSDIDNVLNMYENDGTILDMYSENPTGDDPYSFFPDNVQRCGSYSKEGDCYNREHIIPQSYFGTQAQPMYSDAHFVVPADGKVNGWRDDHPFGVVPGTPSPCNAGATNIPCNTQNGSKLGLNQNSGYSAGYSQKVFEPIDEFKGDIARCILYFATRYEGQLVGFYGTTLSECKVMFDGTSDHAFSDTFLNILLTWNAQDPVSAREIKRNNAVYTRQKNRNPYIDNNSYVTKIWGAPLGTTTFDVLASVSVFPNPTNNHKINIQTETIIDEINLININGQLMQQIKKPILENNVYSIENLNSGFYFLKLISNNQSIVKKVIVN